MADPARSARLRTPDGTVRVVTAAAAPSPAQPNQSTLIDPTLTRPCAQYATRPSSSGPAITGTWRNPIRYNRSIAMTIPASIASAPRIPVVAPASRSQLCADDSG